MARNKFLKRMAVTALAASMTFGTVPAMATSAFAASVSADAFDTKTGDNDLNNAVAGALNGQVFDATTTKEAIKSAVENHLSAGGYVGATAVVTVATPTASSIDKSTDINGNVTYTVTKGKLPISIAVTATKDGNSVSGTYAANIAVDDLTTTEKVAIAKTLASDAANSMTFGAKETPNAAVVVKTINDKISAFNSANGNVLAGVSATNVAFTNTGDKIEGTITLTAGTDSTSSATALTKKVEDSTATFSVARSAAASQITDVKNAFENNTISVSAIKNDTTTDEIIEKANAAIAGNNTYKASGVKVTAAAFVNDTKAKYDAPSSQQVLLTLSDGTNTLTASVTLPRVLSDDEYIAAAKEGIEKAASLVKVSDYQNDNAVTPLADNSNDNDSSDKNSIQDLANNVIASALTYKPNKDSNDTLGTKFNGANISYRITSDKIDYTKATVSKEGKAVITVKFSVANDDYDANDESSESTKTATSTFTVTLPKLKASAAATLAIGTNNTTATSLTVKNETYSKNRTVQLYGIQKNSDNGNANDELTWTSDNGDVAVVDENGKVTLKGVGTATITVTSKSNPSLTDSLKLIVKLASTYKFTDVQDPDAYYFTPVYQAINNQTANQKTRVAYVSGTSDTTFNPSKNVTRGEFVTFLWRLAGKPGAKKSGFTDVKDGSFYAKAINWASQEGIAAGKSSDKFDPNAYVTRAEAVTFLYRAFAEPQSFGANSFDDVNDNAYYAKAVSWAVERGITAGTSVKKFSPDSYTTRGQAVTFIDNSAYGWNGNE